jgi:hypothetical protein
MTPPHFNSILFPIPVRGWVVPSLIEFGPVVLEKKIFKNFQCIFSLSLLSPLREGRSPSFKNLNPLPLRMICAKAG